MTPIDRRRFLGSGAAAAGLASLGLPLRSALAQSGEIVIGAAPPITGVFAFAGAGLHAGLGDWVEWKNGQGGIAGRKLRYVAEDSSYKVDQSVAIFKKIVAQYKPPLFYGDSTGWAKAIAPELSQLGSVLATGPSFASDLADPAKAPYYFMPGPTYSGQIEVLLEYVSRSAAGAAKPAVAFVYSDTEFGRDPIASGKAKAAKLGIPVVLEVVTKPGAVDVSAEVIKLRRAKPDFVIFHGYVLAPIPEFMRQMRDAGMNARGMGTIYTMDKTTIDQMGAAGAGFLGVMPYRYSFDTEKTPTMALIREVGSRKPNNPWQTTFYTQGWLVGMIFEQVLGRTLGAKKELTGPNMKAALESIGKWDTGGIFGVPIALKTHSIPVGRVYLVKGSTIVPNSDWITIG
ncbi:MAG: ABC transporter substrate-binding protein [Burkholderiales bacterium]